MPLKSKKVYLSLGSNLGDSFQLIIDMKDALQQILANLSSSPLYRTAPVGVDSLHNYYLNMVVSGEWYGSALELLAATQKIEKELGRRNKGELAPRTADIDILLFENEIIKHPLLIVPHHALFERKFHILGLVALNAEIVDPSSGLLLCEYPLEEDVNQQEIEIIL